MLGLNVFVCFNMGQVSTQMVGSFGYSAPEFALSGVYTVKSDVYSFGVVMLELLTGRKPLDRYNPFSVIIIFTNLQCFVCWSK